MGGECNYYGCIPSKALLRPVELAAEVYRMPGLALRGPIDTAAVVARRDKAVSHFDDTDYMDWLRKLPATFVRGHGRLAGPRRVEVTTPDGDVRELRARHAVVVATGSAPGIPDVPGLREARPWTNQEATSVRQVPERLGVVGGGPVACEMSQALHALGAKETTVLVRGDRLLARAEPFAGELLARSFAEVGIDVRFGRSPVRVDRPGPGGPVTVHTDDGVRESRPTRSWSAPAAAWPSATSVSPRSASMPAARSSSTRACGRRRCPTAGCTPSGMSTGATSSPTWANTRPASAAT